MGTKNPNPDPPPPKEKKIVLFFFYIGLMHTDGKQNLDQNNKKC